MNNKNKRLSLMSEGNISTALLSLALPTIIAMLVLAIYNYIDSLFIGLLHNQSALAATQVIMPAFQLTGAIGLTFGIGASSIVSRMLGENNIKEARKSASLAFYSAVAIGVLFSIAGMIFPREISLLFGATKENLSYSISYGKIILGGGLFQIMNMTLNNILRSEGAAKLSGIAMISGAIFNIALDPIFIFVFELGITGAAIATIISQGLTTLFLLSFFIRKKSILHLSIRYFQPTVKRYWSIMQIGIPTFIRQIISAFSFILINNLAKEYGDSAQAAFGVTLRTFMIIMMALFGLAQGLQPLAGYNVGAKNLERTKKSLSVALLWTIIATTITSTVFIVFAHPLSKIFLHDNVEALEIAKFALITLSIGLVPLGIVIMYGGYFQAAGSGLSAFIIAIFQQGLFLIPLILIFNQFWGLKGILAAQPVAFILSLGLAQLLRIRVDKILLKNLSI